MVVRREKPSVGNMSRLLTLLSLTIVQVSTSHIQQRTHPTIKEDLSWPSFQHLIQVSGVSADKDGRLHAFHRGDRLWDQESFDDNHQYRFIDQGPIKTPTILVIDISSGKVLYSWGENLFYEPHSITIDDKGNTWVTDVALHQVLKFPPNESKPMMTLGEPFVPGSGKNHFCQPTDVAVDKSGLFFVSDGYCNSRIILFSPSGTFLREIGEKARMDTPHSLTLLLMHGMREAVCVTDREHGKIICFTTGLDGSVPGVELSEMMTGDKVRAFGVDHRGYELFAVNGPHLKQGSPPSQFEHHGIVLDSRTREKKTMFGPAQGFGLPHDLTVTKDGRYVFVSEIDPDAQRKIYKFDIYN